MGGYDEHATFFGEWMPLSPSPRAFFKSILEHPLESKAETLFQESNEQQIISRDHNDQFTQFRPFLEQKMGARGGLVERMAARAGFNAPRLNTESIIRPPDLAPNSDVRSPYLTISPGLSPTTLLESPIFLSNSLVQASPTTGKFQFVPEKNKNQFQDIDSTSFAFKPVAESGLSTFFSAAGKITPTLQSDISRSQSEQQPKLQSQSGAAPHLPANLSRGNTVISEARIIDTVAGSDENSPALDDQQDEETDQMGSGDGSGTTSEDGYNWRKYGQKQVKGSDYPRSYYKCTHLNCPVKKKVERSHEGHITEIIYKGAHNHPKPQPNRRSTLGQIDPQMETTYRSGEDPMWTITQKGRNDSHEISEYCNGTNSFHGQNGTHFELVNVKDGSSTFSNDEEEDDPVIHGSASLGYDGEGDESDSKRRKIEEYASEMSGATRAAREPRVVVQTTSEVDILDDGYRWRKYGQKVVKGNPNPRSYYKCTSSGCLVRKHVERASHDLKSVITTYEGKHNHDVPAARNCGQSNSGSPGNGRAEAGNIISASTHLQRAEPSQVHNNISRFSRPLARNPLGFAFGMNHPGLADLAMARLGPNQGNLFDPPFQPQFGPLSEMDFVLPKGEPKSEPQSEAPLSMPNASSVYSQYMSRLPLGPHVNL